MGRGGGGDETRERPLRGTCVWSSHVMHGRYPLRELCQSARVEIRMKIRIPRQFGGMEGGEPKARAAIWLGGLCPLRGRLSSDLPY